MEKFVLRNVPFFWITTFVNRYTFIKSVFWNVRIIHIQLRNIEKKNLRILHPAENNIAWFADLYTANLLISIIDKKL